MKYPTIAAMEKAHLLRLRDLCAGMLAAGLLGLGYAGGAVAQVPEAQTPAAREAASGASTEAAATSKSKGSARTRRPVERSADFLAAQRVFQILAAEIAAQRDQLGTAAATWLAVARETRDPRAAQRATELALAAPASGRAVEAAELWLELEPAAAEPASALETLWVSSGQLQRAETLIVRQLERARQQQRLAAYYGRLTRSLLRAPDRGAALALLDRVSISDLDEAATRIARATLAHVVGDQARASAEIRSAIALHRGSEDVALAAATVLPVDGPGRQEAIALLRETVAANVRSPRARFALARLLAIDGQLERALEQLERTLADDPDDTSTLFAAAQLAAEVKRPEKARQWITRWLDQLTEAGPERNPGLLLLARLAQDQGQLEQALQWLEQVSSGAGQFDALLHRAVLLGRLKRGDEGRVVLQSIAPATAQERTRVIQVSAELLREEGRTLEAFAVIDAGLSAQPDDPQLLYDRAMLAERLDRLERMESDLRRLIALRPNHAHAYNALGYTFAERNLRLTEARQLIERAVELAPQDPQILDSMGWIEFRQGKLEAALSWLQKAWAIRPDAEVGAHLGEVLWRLGRFDEARQIWREALGQDPDNRLLRETRVRLGAAL